MNGVRESLGDVCGPLSFLWIASKGLKMIIRTVLVLVHIAFLPSAISSSCSDPDDPMMFMENQVDCLNCPVRYGKRPGDSRNHGLVTIRSSVTIIAIHSLSAVDMELTADLYLYQVMR